MGTLNLTVTAEPPDVPLCRVDSRRTLQNDIPTQLEFSRISTTRVQVVFDEPDLSSDGGALLLSEAARLNGIIEKSLCCPGRCHNGGWGSLPQKGHSTPFFCRSLWECSERTPTVT